MLLRREAAPIITPVHPASFADANPQPPVRPAPLPAPAGCGAPNLTLGAIRLRYLARSPILVRGTTSGRAYRFSGEDPVQSVARADAQPLLASGHFRREA